MSKKVAYVTGGMGGIGTAICQRLHKEGFTVIAGCGPTRDFTKWLDEQKALGYTFHASVGNVGDWDSTVEAFGKTKAEHGTIDVLVNNAGASWGAPAEDYPDEAWLKVINLNINGMFFLTREVGKRVFIPKKSGKIIITASIAGLRGNPPDMKAIAYNTSKGADVNFTRTLAAEWGQFNINVNAICPGFFPSKMASGLMEKLGDQLIAGIPLGRVGGPEDLKGLAVLLASDAGRHITGQCIAVDGGSSTF